MAALAIFTVHRFVGHIARVATERRPELTGNRFATRPVRARRVVGTALVAAVTAFAMVTSVAASATVTPRAAASATAGFPTPPSTALNGAGSTFDNPLFTRAFYVYNELWSGVTVNYASIGSGGGEQQFESNTVNFGASDVPMLAADLAKVPASSGPVLQVPVALGGVAIAYNLPGVPAGLKLTPAVLAGIFLGQITTWNNSAITSLNPKMTLPNEPIVTVHRADSSGTSYIFTNYMSEISSTWASQVGTAKSVAWPNGIGGQGNAGVAGAIQDSPGSIGYVELAYVLQNKMTDAAIQNPKGVYVLPTKASVAAEAALHPHVSATNFSITDLGHSKTAYPISGYSWALVYQNQTNATTGTAVADLLYWLTRSKGGQRTATALDYVPLPPNVEQLALTTVQEMVGPSGQKLLVLPKSSK